MNIIFIHGLESSGTGFKGRFFKKIFSDILTPDFTGNLEQRMELLNDILKNINDISIIGSSFGGLMATIYALSNYEKIKKLILLAPALNFKTEDFHSKKIDVPTIIFHGKNDTVVPLEPVKEISQQIFKNLKFNEVNDDHMLHKTIQNINWKTLLG